MSGRIVTDWEVAEWAATLRIGERIPGYVAANDPAGRIRALIETREDLATSLAWCVDALSRADEELDDDRPFTTGHAVRDAMKQGESLLARLRGEEAS